MSDTVIQPEQKIASPQCQYFVVRKKRLCRMTVKPGRQYCGEHEPQPNTDHGDGDTRIPCPNDPKHTCYKRKLLKHLAICNARMGDQPPYVIQNINAPTPVEECPRKPLNQIPKEAVMQVIDKVNHLYEKLLDNNICLVPEYPIHSTVLDEFSEEDRAESSRRHLRQVSSLMWIAQDEGLIQDKTCYVELGAGKGQLSYYLCTAWCESGSSSSRTLLVDRASLRHKRDNKLSRATRIRADLAHLALSAVPDVQRTDTVVGFAKHLCGVATDYALRCITADGVLKKTRGVVLATCCHHRCDHGGYVATKYLQDLGISCHELNTMLGIVSWATCGDGRSRNRRNQDSAEQKEGANFIVQNETKLTQEYREQVGRKAKALLDWGRILYLRDKGFEAKLCYYIPTSVSLENVCIIAKKNVNNLLEHGL